MGEGATAKHFVLLQADADFEEGPLSGRSEGDSPRGAASQLPGETSQASGDDLFLIVAGGTGGHVFPGLQVARELKRRGHSCVFAGTERGQEKHLVPAAGFPIEFLRIGALNKVSLARRLRTLAEAPSSLLAAASILDRTRPRALMSLGGYASGPLLVMAIMRGLPVLILEPNAVPGLAHRLAGPFASRAQIGFPAAAKYFPYGRVEIGGIPIREEFFSLPPRDTGTPLTILITGGSQGAKGLNRAAIASLPLWKTKGLLDRVRFLHQTGAADYQEVRAAYETHGVNARVGAFFDDMPKAFGEADLVVSRAGASAVAELAAAGKPSLLVPYPHAADQHQLRNAEAMAAGGAARVILDAAWDGARFFEEIVEILYSPSILATMGAAARRQARPGAASRAADALQELAGSVRRVRRQG